MIVVCLHVSAVGAAGIDRDSHLFLLTPDAKRGQIRLYRVNPVAFLSADMSDSLYAHRRIGKRRDRRQGQRLIGEIVHIDCDAPQRTVRRSRYPDALRRIIRSTSHALQHFQKTQISLCVVHMHMTHKRPSTGHRRSRIKIAGSRHIRFHRISLFPVGTSVRHLVVSSVKSDTHAEFLHHFPCDTDVRSVRLLAGDVDLHPLRNHRRNQQQRA